MPLPDNAKDRFKGAFLASDTSENNHGPALRCQVVGGDATPPSLIAARLVAAAERFGRGFVSTSSTDNDGAPALRIYSV